MTSVGPNYPGTGASLANAGTSENANAWTNPGNIGSSSAVASITATTFDSPDISEILVASNFGFSIPTDATVKGITVEISKRGYTSTNSGMDFRVQLATGTTFADLVGSNKASGSVWPQTTLATSTYGSASDTWSAGLTASQVNSSGFAVFLSAYANVANADIDVDWIRVTLEYTSPSTISPSAIASAQALPSPVVVGPGALAIVPTGISSAEAAGTVTILKGGVSVVPSAITSGEALGALVLKATAMLLPTGIASAESLGTATLLPGAVPVVVAAIASGETIGAAAAKATTTINLNF